MTTTRVVTAFLSCLIALGACRFQPTIPSGRITCNEQEPCPDGLLCTRATAEGPELCCRHAGCEGDGVSAGGAGAIPGGGGRDAGPGGAVGGGGSAGASEPDGGVDAPSCPTGGAPPLCDPCNGACAGLPRVLESSCVAGICKVVRCQMGYANCDPDTTNGCESDLSDAKTCGTCAVDCQRTLPNAVKPVCSGGVCAEDTCPEGKRHCSTNPAEMCETSVSVTEHCGSCGNDCRSLLNTAAVSCPDGKSCVINHCADKWQDCDGKPSNGCESDLASVKTCGDCSTNCLERLAHVKVASCALGKCTYDACQDAFRDYDGNPQNGCETVTPLGAPEVGSLLLYYTAGVGYNGASWTDRSPAKRNGTCTSCPTLMKNALSDEDAAVFSGQQSIAIGGPPVRFASIGTGGFTLTALFRPRAGGIKSTLVEFADASSPPKNRITVRRSSTQEGSLSLEVCNAGTCQSARFPLWKLDTWLRIAVVTRAGGQVAAVLGDAVEPLQALNVALPEVDLSNNHLGFSAEEATTTTLNGDVAELAVWNQELSDASLLDVLLYYKRKYEL